MTNSSNFVLRWVIDNATAALATKKAESGVFNEGGFKWTIALNAHPSINDGANLTISCGVDHNGPWKCQVEAGLHILHTDGGYRNHFTKKGYCFDEDNSIWKVDCTIIWSTLNGYKINDKITHELRININSSESGQPTTAALFDAPNRMSNVILKIADKTLHVSKELLAVHSPVFETLFLGKFNENGKEEVELKDIVYEEFVDLLHLIYLETLEISDRNVSHILKLADEFKIENILKLSKRHITQSKGLTTMEKLLLADQYRLHSLRDQCLKTFTSTAQIAENLKSSPEYAHFSADMKGAICDRITEF